MKLVNVQVKHFRNILDSGPVDIHENVTCLVGKNESGKTSFLHALYRLRPARKNASFNSQTQYPAWLEKRHRQQGIDVDKSIPVEATFEIEPADRKILDERFGEGAVTSKTVTLKRDYSNQMVTCFNTDEAKAVTWAAKDVKLPKAQSDKRRKVKTFNELRTLIEQMRQGQEGDDSVIKQGAEALQQSVDKMLGETDFRDTVCKVINARLPQFFYFADYSSLPYTVKITELLNADEEQLDDDQLTALSLLRMAASDDEYLLNPDYELRKRELENVGNALTQDVLKYWSQNPELRVDMDISKETKNNAEGQPVAVLDELKIRIRDNRHWLTLPFNEHSTGFQWFFSFLAAFSMFEYGDQPIVILLDEPALGLHARAQKDFLRFIDERLAVKRQVIYTTHSPFMIEPDKLDRARVVEDHGTDEGSIVTSDVLTTDPDTLFPLQGALGYDLVQHLLIGTHNVIIEGTSDFTYLITMSNHLKEQGRTGLDEEWSLVPVGGADLIPTFVALLGHHLDVTIVVDSRREGHQKLSRLAEQGYLKHQRIIPVGTITGQPVADIEDLFAVSDYLTLYNKAFGTSIKATDLQGTDRIIDQIARHQGIDKFDHGKPADVLLRERDKLLPKMKAETLDQFEKLFVAINSSK